MYEVHPRLPHPTGVRRRASRELDLGATGAAIRSCRRRLGWTQADLARRSLVSVDTVRRLEAGGCRRPLVGTLVRIAASLGLSLSDLLAAGGLP